MPSLPEAFTPAARRALARQDPALGALMARCGPFLLERRPLHSPFAALAESIVYQQLTGRAAATIFARVAARVGEGTRLTPEALLATPLADLRACGLSGAKAAALVDLATKTLEGTVPSAREVRGLPDDAVVDRLTHVRGVGPWTVHMLLMFRLGRPDVLPVGDYGVRKGFARWWGLGELPSAAALTAHAEAWRPWRSVASWYLWRATELPEDAVPGVPAPAGRAASATRARPTARAQKRTRLPRP